MVSAVVPFFEMLKVVAVVAVTPAVPWLPISPWVTSQSRRRRGAG
jgi:hypothetical protein